MASSTDLVTITAAMLVPAYVKPATVFTTVAGGSNSSDPYLPRTLATKAGCPGSVNSAEQSPLDPVYTFAITAEGPAVVTIPTLSVPTVV
jgi:hypothetical protein